MMLPTFLSPTLAHKILLIGKSINFIKLCLQKLPKPVKQLKGIRKSLRAINKGKHLTINAQIADSDSDNDSDIKNMDSSDDDNNAQGNVSKRNNSGEKEFSIDYQKDNLLISDILVGITTTELEKTLNNLRYGEEIEKLTNIINNISLSINKRLLKLLEARFFIKKHLLALKKFMLLGQGDFVTCLMDSVGPELKKRANQLYRHNLTGLLDGAIRSSNIQYELVNIINCINIKLLEAAPGDTGWEIFTLDYSVDTPMNTIIHAEALIKYRIAFAMLWRLKRVEWSLASSWKQLTTFKNKYSYEFNMLRSLKSVFHRCNIYRARMMHVINNFCAYLMFEVLETAWIKLEEKVNQANCYDDCIDAHDNYLLEILEKALLTPRYEPLNILIQQLLQTVLRFCSLEETLIAGKSDSILFFIYSTKIFLFVIIDAQASVTRQRVAATVAEDNTKKGQWGTTSSPSSALVTTNDEYDGVPGNCIS